MPGRLLILSNFFLNALTPQEQSTFDARPIEWDDKHREGFSEILPHNFVRTGSIKGLDLTGWRCDRCHHRVYSHGSVLGYGVHVVSRQEISPASPSFFFVGHETDIHLYCTHERWRSFMGKPYARKMTGSSLAVVDSSIFEPNPLLGTLDEIAAFRKKHGFKVPFRPGSPS